MPKARLWAFRLGADEEAEMAGSAEVAGDELAEAVEVLGLLFEHEEGDEFALDEGKIEFRALALEDAADILPISVAAGEGLVNDEVFGAAGAQLAAGNGRPH